MLGLCCHFLEKDSSGEFVNSLNEKTLRLGAFKEGKYSKEKILKTYINNLTNLKNILPKLIKNNIYSYRISSNLFSLFDEVSEEIKYDKEIILLLEEIGKFILDNNMRITSHPDQFVVLSSDNENVIINSKKILEYHAWIFDVMKLPETSFYSINIHGGKKGNSEKLIKQILSLSNNIRNRLTLENDEMAYNVNDLYYIYKETNIPICFDSHHHTFNDSNINGEEALNIAISTWNNIKPLTHLSNTEPELKNGSFKDKRKHSNYIYYIPEYQLKAYNNNLIDIDVEAKLKNLSIDKVRKDFSIK